MEDYLYILSSKQSILIFQFKKKKNEFVFFNLYPYKYLFYNKKKKNK